MTAPPNLLRQLARLVFFVFTLTFVAWRVLVILIMPRRIPDLFLHVGGTHVHDLYCGIFLLSAVGALLLFAPLSDAQGKWLAGAYSLGLGSIGQEGPHKLSPSHAFATRNSFHA